MLRRLVCVAVWILAGCSAPVKAPEPSPVLPDLFAGRKGCFLLYNVKTAAFEKVVGEENCRERFPACSTFKVPLAVMAFDSRALKNEDQVLKWDGKKDAREESNRDHNARTWMSQSIVWFSQRLTPKIGASRMQKYLNGFDYGNKDMRGGLTQAWLVSPGESASAPALKISAYEQAEFMKKLWSDRLPASMRSMRMARELTYLETSPKGFRLSGKTGSNFYDKAHKIHLGWFVSHLQSADKEYIAVVNFSDLAPSEEPGYGGQKAKAITKKYLEVQGLW